MVGAGVARSGSDSPGRVACAVRRPALRPPVATVDPCRSYDRATASAHEPGSLGRHFGPRRACSPARPRTHSDERPLPVRSPRRPASALRVPSLAAARVRRVRQVRAALRAPRSRHLPKARPAVLMEIRQPQLGMRNGDRQRRQGDRSDRRDRSNGTAGEQRSSREQTELGDPLRQYADAGQRRGATDAALLTAAVGSAPPRHDRVVASLTSELSLTSPASSA